jgi:hypothetical protein
MSRSWETTGLRHFSRHSTPSNDGAARKRNVRCVAATAERPDPAAPPLEDWRGRLDRWP